MRVGDRMTIKNKRDKIVKKKGKMEKEKKSK